MQKTTQLENMPLKDEVYAIMGAAIEVHRVLGPGFLEPVYQEALELELSTQGIPFLSQKPLAIQYKEHTLNKQYIADLICFNQVIIELKAIECLTSREEAQLLNYLNATNMKVGLLINFGAFGRLEWRRLIH